MDDEPRRGDACESWLRSLAVAACGAPVFVGYAALFRAFARRRPAQDPDGAAPTAPAATRKRTAAV